ncbi:MAG: tRNA-dihydrouridine synthase [Planctomycetota bacterium]
MPAATEPCPSPTTGAARASAIGRPLVIGGVRLSTNLLLAPIANYCDLAFRLICREQGGVGLACTDLLSPQGLLRGTATSLDLARTNAEDSPVGMQLYGADPAIMAQGARWAADHGATIVDINMGCPVDKVCKKDGGSKLMCDPERAIRIAEAVRTALPDGVPLTAKMRLGWSEADCRNGVAGDLAVRLVGVGVSAITVHGRTTEMKFSGACRRDEIRRVVEAVKSASPDVPVIGNGDVREPRHAIAMLEDTGCDGVMIGRGALSTPWIFRDAWTLQTMGRVPPEPSDAEKLAIVERFFDLMVRYRGEHFAMTQIRRRISWFGKRINGGRCKDLKESVRLAGTISDVRRALRRGSGAPRAHRGVPALQKAFS